MIGTGKVKLFKLISKVVLVTSWLGLVSGEEQVAVAVAGLQLVTLLVYVTP